MHRSLPTHNRANQHPSINHSCYCDLLCQSRNRLFHPLFIDFHSHVITAAVHFISPIISVSVACNHRGHHSSLPPSRPPSLPALSQAGPISPLGSSHEPRRGLRGSNLARYWISTFSTRERLPAGLGRSWRWRQISRAASWGGLW